MRIFLIVFFLNFNLYAKEKNLIFKVMKKDEFSQLSEKNGISLDILTKDFDKKFKLVATHFRDDKGELRFIYGNEKAFKGFKTKNFDYEDGTIFYKIVYQAEKDPSFQASLRPQQQPYVRQIMLRDKKKYKDTNGWGYAIFTDDGKTLPGDPDKTLATCYACHQIVGERNDIFSRPIETIIPNNKIASNSFSPTPTKKEVKTTNNLFKFKIGTTSDIPSDIVANVGRNSFYNILDGDILKQDFPGYMAEISSFLMKETLKNGFPSLAFKKFQDQFIYSYTYIDQYDTSCKPNQSLVRIGFGSANDFQTKSHLRLMKKCVAK